jgi:hypothetical protein
LPSSVRLVDDHRSADHARARSATSTGVAEQTADHSTERTAHQRADAEQGDRIAA